MKKAAIMLIMVFATVILGLTAVKTEAFSTETAISTYDIDEDGRISIIDVIAIKNCVLEGNEIQNRKFTARDLLLLQEYVLKGEQIAVTTTKLTTTPQVTTTVTTTSQVTTTAVTTVSTPQVTTLDPAVKVINLNELTDKSVTIEDLKKSVGYEIEEEKELRLIAEDGTIFTSSLEWKSVGEKGMDFKDAFFVDEASFMVFAQSKKLFVFPMVIEPYAINNRPLMSVGSRNYDFYVIKRSEAVDEFLKAFWEVFPKYLEMGQSRMSFAKGKANFTVDEKYQFMVYWGMDGIKDTPYSENDEVIAVYDDKETVCVKFYGSETGYYAVYSIY